MHKVMDKLASEVIADLRNWNVTDDPEVKAAFNGIRNGIENARLGFTQTKVEHSKGRMPPWVALHFKGPNGQIDLTWHLSQRLGDLADVASNAKLASDKQAGDPPSSAIAQVVLVDADSFAPTVMLNLVSGGYHTGAWASKIVPWIEKCAKDQVKDGGAFAKNLVQGASSKAPAWGGAQVRVEAQGQPRVEVDHQSIKVTSYWVIKAKMATPNNTAFRDAVEMLARAHFFEFVER